MEFIEEHYFLKFFALNLAVFPGKQKKKKKTIFTFPKWEAVTQIGKANFWLAPAHNYVPSCSFMPSH